MNDDPIIERAIRVARRPVDIDPRALARALDAARSVKRHWLLQPRLSPALTAALLLGVFLLGRTIRVNTPQLSEDVPATEGITATTFVLIIDHARDVRLVGDFNDWSPEGIPLLRQAGSVWSAVVPLAPGSYNYAYVVDGETWMSDPAAPPATDTFGRPGSVILVEHGTL